MKHRRALAVGVMGAMVLTACAAPGLTATADAGGDHSLTVTPRATITVHPPTATPTASPKFNTINTSSRYFARSDCSITSITVTANITDPSGIEQVVLWYRVGSSGPYTRVEMDFVGDDSYRQTVQGTEVPGSDYGVWEFYLTARDRASQMSQSPVDTSVSLLACVGG